MKPNETTMSIALEEAGMDHVIVHPKLADMTEFELDQLAKRLKRSDKPDLAAEWQDEFTRRIVALCEMFSADDGDEKILANKLADHITHFFDRERSKIHKYASSQTAQIAMIRNGDDEAASEVSDVQIERIRERLQMLREQYAVCNLAFTTARDKARHAVFAQTGISWNSSYRTHEMHQLIEQIGRLNKKLTSDLLEADRTAFFAIKHSVTEKEARLKKLRKEERLKDKLMQSMPPDDGSGPVFDNTASGGKYAADA